MVQTGNGSMFAVSAVALAMAVAGFMRAARPSRQAAVVAGYHGLTGAQDATLLGIARDTWKFYSADVDPATHLPMDNLTFAGGSAAPTSYGRYTSAANIGVYLWAVVAAKDLGLIGRPQAASLVQATLTEVQHLRRFDGFLYQWYDTTTGDVIRNPGDIDCSAETTPTFDNCYFVSNVDNGWYASGLIVVRQALPELSHLADSLIAPMNFGIFYDGRAETHCNTNPAITGNQPTGQMYGGYYAGLPPDQGDNWMHYYHNGALYSDPRISAYIGMGLHQMPGNVWWRSWRELPPPAPFPDCQTTDPDFSWQGQWPMGGSWQTYADPQSGQQFPVWEGHYTYPGSGLTFIPTYSGGMFEGLMPNEVVPETSWGPQSFGLADVRTAQVQIKYATAATPLPGLGNVAVEHTRRHRRIRRLRGGRPDLPLLRDRRRCEPPERRPLAMPWLRDGGRRHAARFVPGSGRGTAAGLRQHPGPARALPGRVRRRRLLRCCQPGHRGGRPPLPGARPVHDHGGPGQCAQRPRDPARLRPRPSVLGGTDLPVAGENVDLNVEAVPRLLRGMIHSVRLPRTTSRSS